jgi:ABC-2 type transport system ATP-binding protein
VLDRVSLTVPAGCIFGFLGPNGSGKTTTIRLLLGLIRAPAQTVKLFGEDIGTHRLPILARVGALIESPTLYPHLSGRNNLQISRIARGLPLASVEMALSTVELADEAGRSVRTYSLGMRQRLGIALALLGDPELLILDEPTNGLDPEGAYQVRMLLTKLCNVHGKTIFVSSHLLNEMEKMITHVAILDQGKLLFQGQIGTLKETVTTIEGEGNAAATIAAASLEDIFLNLTRR